MGNKGLKLNKKLIDEALKLFANGLNITDTCSILNIHRDTYYNWLKKANEIKPRILDGDELSAEERLYLDISDVHEKGMSLFKKRRLENIIGDESWQSDAWLLERKFPNEFGRNQTPIIDNRKTEVRNILVLNNLGEAIEKELSSRSTKKFNDRTAIAVTEKD